MTGVNAATFTTRRCFTKPRTFRAQVTTTATSNVATITWRNNLLVTRTNIAAAPAWCRRHRLLLTACRRRCFGALLSATGGTAWLRPTATHARPHANTTYYAEVFTGGMKWQKPRLARPDGGFCGNTGLVFTACAGATPDGWLAFNATATAGSITVELRDNATGTLVLHGRPVC
jgi:hypothetical protein